MSKIILVSLLAMAGAALVLGGCFSPSKPLVVVNGTEWGSPPPDTEQRSSDSDQVRDLKNYASKLEKQLADAKEDREKEKAKRERVEDERDDLKKRIDRLKDDIEDLEEQLDKARRR